MIPILFVLILNIIYEFIKKKKTISNYLIFSKDIIYMIIILI